MFIRTCGVLIEFPHEREPSMHLTMAEQEKSFKATRWRYPRQDAGAGLLRDWIDTTNIHKPSSWDLVFLRCCACQRVCQATMMFESSQTGVIRPSVDCPDCAVRWWPTDYLKGAFVALQLSGDLKAFVQALAVSSSEEITEAHEADHRAILLPGASSTRSPGR